MKKKKLTKEEKKRITKQAEEKQRKAFEGEKINKNGNS